MTYYSHQASNHSSFRRQFNVSLGLIVAMAIAAFLLGFALPVTTAHHSVDSSSEADLSIGRLINLHD